MALLNLTVDEVLTTTRAVRKRLDLTRPVEPEILCECFEIAVQAPTPGGTQGWHFIVVTDPDKKRALANLYRRAMDGTREGAERDRQRVATNPQRAAEFSRMMDSSQYLAAHLHEVPVLVIPCLGQRVEGLPLIEQATQWGGIFPAVWSFMLAARARGLGTTLTGMHLIYEREAAEILGIPETILQVGLLPVAYTIGTDFKPAVRQPLDQVLHWEQW